MKKGRYVYEDRLDVPDNDNLESYFYKKDTDPCDDYWDELAGLN